MREVVGTNPDLCDLEVVSVESGLSVCTTGVISRYIVNFMTSSVGHKNNATLGEVEVAADV